MFRRVQSDQVNRDDRRFRPGVEANEGRLLMSVAPRMRPRVAELLNRQAQAQSQSAGAAQMEVCSKPLDLVVVVDGSESIDQADFLLIKQFLHDFADRFAFGTDKANMGLVQFSTEGQGKIERFPTADPAVFDQAIDSMVQIQGGTDIQEGLQLGQAALQERDRPNAPNLILLLTDGKDNQPGDPVAEAASIKAAGTRIAVVGIGPQTDRTELNAIASDPTSTFVTYVDTFQALASSVDHVAEVICDAATLLQVRLNPASDSGISNSDGITNVKRPVFDGVAAPGSAVRVLAQRADSTGAPIVLGQAVADSTGNWSLTSTALPDGNYNITAEAGNGASAALPQTLVIDTIGPVVAGMEFDALQGTWRPQFRDERSGIAQSTLVTGNFSAVAMHAPLRDSTLTIAGVQTSPPSDPTATQTVTIPFTAPSPIRGAYGLRIKSGGITDVAGNALDGEYRGRFPSGNGQPGGDFGAAAIIDGRGVARRFQQLSTGLSSHINTRDPNFDRTAAARGSWWA